MTDESRDMTTNTNIVASSLWLDRLRIGTMARWIVQPKIGAQRRLYTCAPRLCRDAFVVSSLRLDSARVSFNGA